MEENQQQTTYETIPLTWDYAFNEIMEITGLAEKEIKDLNQ